MTSDNADSIDVLLKYIHKIHVLMFLEPFRVTMQQLYYKCHNKGGIIFKNI